MRLTDLSPTFINGGGHGITYADGTPVEPRVGLGVEFDCPCGAPSCPRCYVPFANPIDGLGRWGGDDRGWQREGVTFDTLTLTPSIRRNRALGGCGWHGFITAGEVSGRVE